MKLSDFMQEEALISIDLFRKMEIIDQLLSKEITAQELDGDYSPRLLNDWHKKNLLPPHIKEKKRKRFSPTDCIWLGLVSNMKSLGISSSIITKVRDTVYEPFDLGIIFGNKEIIKQIISKTPEDEQKEAEAFLMEKKNLKTVQKDLSFSFLDVLIIDLLSTREELNIWIDQEGESLVIKPTMVEELMNLEEFSDFMRKPFFSISLSEKMGDFIIQSENKKKYDRLKLLTYNEEVVIKEMRDKSNAVISVKKLDESGQILIDSKTPQTSMTRDEYIQSIVRKGKYSYIVNTDNGKTLQVQRTKKQKL